jgi:hypothetical protein
MEILARINTLAAAIMDNFFLDWGSEDAKELLEIVDCYVHFFQQVLPVWYITEANMRKLILERFLELDDIFGWDAPHQNESMEDFIYTFLVTKRIEQHVNGTLNPPDLF